MKCVRYAVVVVAAALSTAAHAVSQNIETAIAFLKEACVTSGSATAIDISVATDGGLVIRKDKQSANTGNSVTITRKEMQGLADSASAVAAQQASEMRACMKPYVDRIVTALLDATADQGPRNTDIKTEALKWIDPEVSAATYGEHWIALLDQSRFREAYDSLDTDQKAAYTLEEFQSLLSRAWKPQGMLLSRTLVGTQPVPSQSDTPPDSKFFIVAFRTKWEHDNGTGFPGDEIVILRLSPNGKWHVSRYVCLACTVDSG